VILLQKRYTPEEMLGIIGYTDIVIGMRLHSLIMAAARKIRLLRRKKPSMLQ
jgi:polysaccharide pyruvyl transferase WcaK-like protein